MIRAVFVEQDVMFLLPDFSKTMGVVSAAVNLFTCDFMNDEKGIKSFELYDELITRVIIEAVKIENKHLSNYQLRVSIRRTTEEQNPLAVILLSAAQQRLPFENPGMMYRH